MVQYNSDFMHGMHALSDISGRWQEKQRRGKVFFHGISISNLG
jgi:hypothetical protein